MDNKKEEHVKAEQEYTIDPKDMVEKEDNELNERINRLYGISEKPPKEEKHYDPKELEETRKKLILLLIGVILFCVGCAIVLINPFGWGEKKEDTPIVDTDDEEPDEEDTELPLGEIDISNSLAQELNNLVKFNENDFLVIDLYPLYTNEVLLSSNIPNNIKLYMMKKNSKFKDMLVENGIDEYIDTCDPNGLVINKSEFDKLVGISFGPNVIVNYDTINYLYYDNHINQKLTFTYTNDTYVVKCNDYQEEGTLTKYLQQGLFKANKTEEGIEIYQKVVFISPNGVYKDPNFTTLITNDREANEEDYLSYGSTYKYTFIEHNEDYYLSKIELVKEDIAQ